MSFDQKGVSIFCVTSAAEGLWEVKEEGFEVSLASFASSKDAQTYARDLAKSKPGSTVKVFDQDGRRVTDEGTPALLRA